MAQLLNLARQLLEYYGVPPELFIQRCEACLRHMVQMITSYLPSHTVSRAHFDQLCAISRNYWVSWYWERKQYGSSRSFVRQVAKCLSLTPCPRPHFPLVQTLTSSECEQNSIIGSVSPSLADILWMADNGKGQFVRFRTDKWSEVLPPPPVTVASRGREQKQILNEDAFKKISALESELAHLRAQIATIVAVQKEGNSQSYSDMVKLSSTTSDVLLQPSLTSTPVPTSHCNAVPLPPPPPPPPPLPPPSAALPSHFDSYHSVLEHTNQCQAESKIRNITDNSSCQKDKICLSMMDVLKDINKIKLRAVERSPGGTPLSKREKVMNSQWDPAALIAKALKEKFASQINNDNDSFDKENSSCGSSLFSSPQSPKVCCHTLKPSMKQTPARDNELVPLSATKRPVHI